MNRQRYRQGKAKTESITQAGVGITRNLIIIEIAGTLETQGNKGELATRHRNTHRLNTLGDEAQVQTIGEGQTINKVEHTQGRE